MDITIRSLHKRYADTVALHDINLDIRSGELIALLGPSGSGKTTLLRAIAGLEFAERGQILFGGRDASSLSVQERRVGFVFQHYALFRHMSVLDNIAFGLRCKPRSERPEKAEILRRAQALLETVQLGALGARYPHQLSGGQRQRVALARAMAIDPTVLLLDEPFGALDAKVRTELRAWLRQIHDDTGYTTVFVTHDQEEAMELADRVVVLDRGRIEQIGSPDEVYRDPQTPFVFDFLGRGNVIEGEFGRDGFVPAGQRAQRFRTTVSAQGAGRILVRPHDFSLGAPDEGLGAKVRRVRRLGGRVTLDLDVDGQVRPLEVDLAAGPELQLPREGERVGVTPLRFHVLG